MEAFKGPDFNLSDWVNQVLAEEDGEGNPGNVDELGSKYILQLQMRHLELSSQLEEGKGNVNLKASIFLFFFFFFSLFCLFPLPHLLPLSEFRCSRSYSQDFAGVGADSGRV
jgi:hypothetical protein